jgi:tetratricopeptide (TPR) repeat protein
MASRQTARGAALTLQQALNLRVCGEHEKARELLARLAAELPDDGLVQYEAACVHDSLGFESQAVPFYAAALAADLPAKLRRSAYTGLGSTYRTLGLYREAQDTLERGLMEFPEANKIRVFLAMACYNLGESKLAVESLLKLLAVTTNDPEVKAYSQAIDFYAQDLDRSWLDGAA